MSGSTRRKRTARRRQQVCSANLRQETRMVVLDITSLQRGELHRHYRSPVSPLTWGSLRLSVSEHWQMGVALGVRSLANAISKVLWQHDGQTLKIGTFAHFILLICVKGIHFCRAVIRSVVINVGGLTGAAWTAKTTPAQFGGRSHIFNRWNANSADLHCIFI